MKSNQQPGVKTPPVTWRDHLDVHPACELLPLVPHEELQALAADMEARGLLVRPVLWSPPDPDDKYEALIDGRNRLDALALAGLLAVDDSGRLCFKRPNGELHEIRFQYANPNTDPYKLVLSLNIHRRHLSAEQKRELIAKLLKATPEKSDRQIAKETDSNRTTVGQVRKEKEKSGDVSIVDTRTDSRGRKQQTHKSPTKNSGVAAAADRAEARSKANEQASAGNDIDPQESADRRKALAAQADHHTAKLARYSVREWETLAASDRKRIIAAADGQSQFNPQTNDSIEWARWSWNPITGCLHDCDYCYARDIAERFFEQGFEPTFLPDRLAAPRNTNVPTRASAEIGFRNVFVCSMADLFGKWVPDDWIDAVFDQVRTHPQWNFLFLTKFPQRLAERQWPVNAWCGTTVDTQARVKIAERAFRDVKAGVRWLSVEPMMERLTFTSLEMFNWIVIGGATKSTRTPAFDPPMEWVLHLLRQAHAAGIESVYAKANLNALRGYPSAAVSQ